MIPSDRPLSDQIFVHTKKRRLIIDWFNSWDEVAEYVASLPAGHMIKINKKTYFKAANCDNTHIYESFFCPETGKIIHFSHLIKPNNLEEEVEDANN